MVFERLESDVSEHGNYNFFRMNVDGTGLTRLSSTGFAQGLASWSNSGDEIVFAVAAVNDQGQYRLHMMNADGSNRRDVTPAYFPQEFLCHSAIFSLDDTKLYFVGEWWE